MAQRKIARKRPTRPRIGKRKLDDMIEAATVDCYNESEPASPSKPPHAPRTDKVIVSFVSEDEGAMMTTLTGRVASRP